MGRRCKATTRAGNRCKAFALRDGDHCLSHDKNAREKARFSGKQENAGRPRKPKPTEIARRLVEENIVAVQRPYWRALGFDVEVTDEGPRLIEIDGGAKLHGTQQRTGKVVLSEHDDLSAMMTAAERLQDRVFGRPRQALEVTGEDGGPIQTYDLSKLTTEQIIELRQTLKDAAVEPAES